MRKSPNLEKICNLLFSVKPDWDKIKARFRTYREADKPHTLKEYTKYFSEIHLDLCIEDIKNQHPEYNISLRPVEEIKRSIRRLERMVQRGKRVEREQADQYASHDSSRRVSVYSNTEKKNYEYDKIIKVGDLPVVFEIKITKWSRSKKHKASYVKKGKRQVQYKEGAGIKNTLRPEVYEKRLEPVCQFFGRDVGYVAVIPQDMYYPRDKLALEGSIYRNFKDNGGIVVPFYTDRKDFREEVLEKVKDYGLKLKEAS